MNIPRLVTSGFILTLPIACSAEINAVTTTSDAAMTCKFADDITVAIKGDGAGGYLWVQDDMSAAAELEGNQATIGDTTYNAMFKTTLENGDDTVEAYFYFDDPNNTTTVKAELFRVFYSGWAAIDTKSDSGVCTLPPE